MATKRTIILLTLLLCATLALSYQSEEKQQQEELQQCKQKCRQQPHYDHQGCESRCEKQHVESEKQQQEEEQPGSQHNHHHKDPQQRLQDCRHQCQQIHQGQQEKLKWCQNACEKQYQETQHQQEQQQQEEEEKEEEGSGSRSSDDKKLRKCKDKCQEHGRPKLSQCERECEDEYKGSTGSSGGGEDNRHGQQEQHEQEEDNNPYFFGKDSFKDWVRTEHGNVKILERFDERSDLLQGIANYRVSVLEADPQTFVVPNHWDAEALFFIANGNGVINLLTEDNRETHELREGDIFRVPAGTIVYIVNKDRKEKLWIVTLIQPISTPGHFESFVDAGGENPESYFQSFSDEVLETAFNVKRDRIQKVFSRQSKGVIIKASEEQIRKMSHRSSEGGVWPWGGSESQQQRPFNLLNKRPSHSNRRGKHYEADESDYQQLKDLNVQVSFANITGGSMMAPFYNSHVTKVSVVLEGRGSVETICPHLASQQWSKSSEWKKRREQQQQEGQNGRQQEEQEQQGQHGRQQEEQEQQGQRGHQQEQQGQQGRQQEEQEQEGQKQEQQGRKRYQMVRSELSRGSVIVTPAGHPTAWIASRGENLQVVCFEINARNNVRFWVAGKNNILKKLDQTAKQLAFDTSAREVDRLLDSQGEEVFVQGPEERQREMGGQGSFASILDFAGF